MVDHKAHIIMYNLFQTWNLPAVRVSFYHTEDHIHLVRWIPNKHYSGVYGLLKLTFPDILPNNITKIITLDTDITFVHDIGLLWKEFDKFNKNQAIGLIENQSDWYFGKLWNNYQPWPAIGRGFNTGVMLMDKMKLKSLMWSKLWNSVADKYLELLVTTRLADQDIINAVIKDHPHLLYQLDCNWNVQLSDNTLSDTCYSVPTDVKVIHWNSPRKTSVKNKHIDYFRNLYMTFLEYNGNLLRSAIFNCDEQSTLSDEYFSSNQCADFVRVQSRNWRTHLFILEFDYQSSEEDSDVTLIAQLSFDRIQIVEELSKHWNGPISLTLYLSDPEVQQFVTYVLNSVLLKRRRNVAYHVVYKDGEFYPVNYLRNVGLKNVNTQFVFLTDIDFLPMYGLYQLLKNHIMYLGVQYLEKTALVVPAFETQRYRMEFPKSKIELLHMLDQSILFTFRYHVWAKGHAATNYAKWRSTSVAYQVTWEPDYEPYIVVSKNIPLYDTRFVGFGWNKVSHIMELYVQGYKFIVLPNAFIIHMPHAPSMDIARFRTSSHYRICLKIFKEEFIEDLKKRYINVNVSKIVNTTYN